MSEQNRTTLKDALSRMPVYAPPAKCWQEIGRELDKVAAEAPLHSALHELPAYTPPSMVWARITDTLEADTSQQQLTEVLALGLWWAWPQPDEAPLQATYTYDQQTTRAQFASIEDWGQADALMQKAVNEFREDPVAKQLPTYELLLSEWADLKDAQEEVAKMMERYGKDAQLIRQMSEIEKERSGLIREMITQI